MANPILTVEHVYKDYTMKNSKQSFRAVEDVSFTIEKGSTLGIIGESGSGKSTLGKMIVGILDQTSGTITYLGNQNLIT